MTFVAAAAILGACVCSNTVN